MTALNKQALRQKAEKAGVEEWQSRKMPGSGGECTVIVKGSIEKHPGWSTCRPVADEIVDKKTMDFIAAANPATVLALIDELEAAEKRIAEQIAIVAAAEKLVRCKGRYHSELNYRSLAKLFGVTTPDLPPLEHENVHYADAAEMEIAALRQRINELESRTVTMPPLNDDLIAILGRPNFTCSHLAELMRKSGDEIRRKSEHEQAAVIHWFLGIYLEYGDKWEGIAKADIQSRVAAAGIGVKGE